MAPFYDDIAGLVYGQPLFLAQLYSLQHVQNQTKLLIVGGGTGWILPYLFKQAPQTEIWFVDISSHMIEIANKKVQPGQMVHLIHGTERDIPKNVLFDTVLLHFYVDGFTQNDLPVRLDSIHTTLKPNANWLIADFADSGKKHHRFLLWLTHRFFRFTVKHPNTRLQNWQKVLNHEGYEPVEECYFGDGLIKTMVYKNKDVSFLK